MPKLQNATETEIRAAIDAADEALGAMQELTNRLEKGYCDQLRKPSDLARSLSVIARAASGLAVHVLAKQSAQEQRAELDTLMRERAALSR